LPTSDAKPSLARTLLVLGRVSNLPTVWSNCLAGWLLAGGGDWQRLLILCGGVSLLYTGGMYLNDACDVRFDTALRSERPIPSGHVSARTVWILSWLWVFSGAVTLIALERRTAVWVIGLASCIIAYDFLHKRTVLAPLLMGGCRFLLYPTAAICATAVTSIILWSATALAAYVIGLSYLARGESNQGSVQRWLILLLMSPIAISVMTHEPAFDAAGLAMLAALFAWVGWCLIPLLRRRNAHIIPGISRLLAGLVLVDLVAVRPSDFALVAVFLLLFGSALILQKAVPAT